MKLAHRRAYNRVTRGNRTCIVTFKYADDDFRTLVADSRAQAFEHARQRWGDNWIGEPCVSTAWSVYCDVVGITAQRYAHDLDARYPSPPQARARRRFREGK